MSEKVYCDCGFIQSYPIPHEHNQTEREKTIIKYYEEKLASKKAGRRGSK